jgi:hypothetical protein
MQIYITSRADVKQIRRWRAAHLPRWMLISSWSPFWWDPHPIPLSFVKFLHKIVACCGRWLRLPCSQSPSSHTTTWSSTVEGGCCNTPGFKHTRRCYHLTPKTLIGGKILKSSSTSFIFKYSHHRQSKVIHSIASVKYIIRIDDIRDNKLSNQRLAWSNL